MAPLHDDAATSPAAPRAAFAVLLAVGLIAGCGGDRSRAGAAGDTTTSAVVPPDSAAMPVADSTAATRGTAPSAGDTSAKPSASGAPAAPATAPQKIAAKPKPTRETAAAPAGQATRETAPAPPAESTKVAAAAPPAQAPAPQQQGTSKAAAAADQPLRDAYHQAPRDTVTQAVYEGWKQFNLNCARCHGEDVLGTTIAPHLIVSLKPDGPINTKELFVQTVCAGRPTKGMPSWCALGLDMGKINEIYEYVKGRSDAKIGPGRPAVKQQG